ncbi:tetratricopeptide repeat protein [Thalassotalea sp. PLHSN55]|uniref:tetratricopeptide repeat protein n=1 Tax=Thalassotalea sp. PLHSN55 TaxID=3435888 RepID=UPI003F8453EE
MSVINQMLKDLEQRNNEPNQVHHANVPVSPNHSSKKSLFIIILVVALLNVVGIYIWQLYSENQQLKDDASQSQVTQHQHAVNEQLTNELSANEQSVNEHSENEHFANKNTAVQASPREPSLKAPVAINTAEPVETTNSTAKSNAPVATPVEKPKHDELPTETSTVKSQPETASSPQMTVQLSSSVESEKLIDEPTAAAKVAEVAEKPAEKSSFSITRRQLSSAELAAQKMQHAEKVLAENNVEKAEQLFEDILMLQPEHKQARKKLAALWFGRQAYQSAINVLSQGISLDPNDSDFRLMSARIYLKVGKVKAALNTLSVLPDTPNKEYQLLLANVAQQSENFDLAINAYKHLLTIEPNNSRWWLGLAIAYDSNSQFEQASLAYQSALELGDLSASSSDFAQQRLQELGE